MSWSIAEDASGRMAIRHDAPPRFTALWVTGPKPASIAFSGGALWTDKGHDLEDTIHLFAFTWIDPAPDPHEFGALMQDAVRAIEAHILR